MSSKQHNRGPHPADIEIFSRRFIPRLQQATCDLSWLLSRGYAQTSSLKLVGDRFDLVARQRIAVMRSACSDDALRNRRSKSIGRFELAGCDLEIDGLNLLITLEAALAGAVILMGRDGTYRDMASIHGSYRKVDQTEAAIHWVRRYLEQQHAGRVIWRIDRPVSNSGRLRSMLMQHGQSRGLPWQVRLDDDPDRVLGGEYELVVSADAAVMDRAGRWANLARWIIDAYAAEPWILPMVGPSKLDSESPPPSESSQSDL